MKNIFCFSALLTLTFSISLPSHADIFAFKDDAGFEKCLQTDHLVEVEKGKTKEDSRYLDQNEIIQRCIEKAVILLKQKAKDKATLYKFIKITQQQVHPERPIDFVQILIVDGGLIKECNEIINYKILLDVLSHPKDYPSAQNSYYKKAALIVKKCLANEEFKKDFMEEKNKPDGYLKESVCSILISEKLIKDCKTPATAVISKTERDFLKNEVNPEITAAQNAMKTSCGCDLKITIDEKTATTADQLYEIKHVAGSIKDSVAGYCKDAATKATVCKMKTLEIRIGKETNFTFASGKGIAVTDGNSFPGFPQMIEVLFKKPASKKMNLLEN